MRGIPFTIGNTRTICSWSSRPITIGRSAAICGGRSTLDWRESPLSVPAGFPHRVSALSNPVAPITHHWLDSTHITFGLVTTGVYDRRWKAEVSLFNGREPDENRADLDLAPLDSVSARVSFAPTSRLVVQVSAAHLHEAEAEFAPQPRTSTNRVTASATYHRPFGTNGTWATTLAYGLNSGLSVIPDDVIDELTHGALLESSLTAGERHTWFGRVELVGKPAHDLHAHEDGHAVFPDRQTPGRVRASFQALEGDGARHWRDDVGQLCATAARAPIRRSRSPLDSGCS